MPLIGAIIGGIIADIMFDFQLRGWCFLIGLGLIFFGIASIYDNLFNNEENFWGNRPWGSGFKRFSYFVKGILTAIVGWILISI